MQPQRKFLVKKVFFFFNVVLGELVLVGTWESYKDILMNTSTDCIRRSFWSLFHLQINDVQIIFFKWITVNNDQLEFPTQLSLLPNFGPTSKQWPPSTTNTFWGSKGGCYTQVWLYVLIIYVQSNLGKTTTLGTPQKWPLYRCGCYTYRGWSNLH